MLLLFFAATAQERFEKWKIGVELPEGIKFGTKEYFDFLEGERRKLKESGEKVKKEASAVNFLALLHGHTERVLRGKIQAF